MGCPLVHADDIRLLTGSGYRVSRRHQLASLLDSPGRAPLRSAPRPGGRAVTASVRSCARMFEARPEKLSTADMRHVNAIDIETRALFIRAGQGTFPEKNMSERLALASRATTSITGRQLASPSRWRAPPGNSVFPQGAMQDRDRPTLEVPLPVPPVKFDRATQEPSFTVDRRRCRLLCAARNLDGTDSESRAIRG